jgi:hypothetical protein
MYKKTGLNNHENITKFILILSGTTRLPKLPEQLKRCSHKMGSLCESSRNYLYMGAMPARRQSARTAAATYGRLFPTRPKNKKRRM